MPTIMCYAFKNAAKLQCDPCYRCLRCFQAHCLRVPAASQQALVSSLGSVKGPGVNFFDYFGQSGFRV